MIMIAGSRGRGQEGSPAQKVEVLRVYRLPVFLKDLEWSSCS